MVHIPRCGGTSIENAIIGEDWYHTDPVFGPASKHIIASTAKKLYWKYWDDYFKFSFVRNPWDRMLSMVKYDWFYGCELQYGRLNIAGYLKDVLQVSGRNLEVDKRSVSSWDTFPDSRENCVYGNILNEDLDFVGKLENIDNDLPYVLDRLGIQNFDCKPAEVSAKVINRTAYTPEVRDIVADIYAEDIARYGYSYE